MRIAPDTNLLARVALRDDTAQARQAWNALKDAEVVAISTLALCELVWVLRSVYKSSPHDISVAVSKLVNAQNVVVDTIAVGVGLRVMQEGGDFADGIIAYEGARLGGETFVSFDKKAVACVSSTGRPARLLA